MNRNCACPCMQCSSSLASRIGRGLAKPYVDLAQDDALALQVTTAMILAMSRAQASPLALVLALATTATAPLALAAAAEARATEWLAWSQAPRPIVRRRWTRASMVSAVLLQA